MSAISLRGAFPVAPTPFTATGEVDEVGFRRVLAYMIESGAAGIVFPGLASEYDHLTLDERKRLIAIVGEVSRGKARFIVGASGQDVEESLAMAEAGAAAGAVAAMVMTPRWLEGRVADIAAFYTDLGRRTALPLMLQNAPKPMGLGLSAEAVAEVVQSTNAIAYVKEETQPCGQRIAALLALTGTRLTGVFGGAGGRHIVDEMARGAVGTMPAAELTEGHVALILAADAGESGTVRDLYERMLPLLTMQAVYRWSLTKEVLRRRGLIANAFVRAPGPRLDPVDQSELTALLDRLTDMTGPLLREPAAA